MKTGEIRHDASIDEYYLVVFGNGDGNDFKRIWISTDPAISVYSPTEGDKVMCDLSDAFGVLENLLKGRKK